MPTYNRVRYLEDAIYSVLNQTYPTFELLIIDDGSTDKTRDLVKYFTNKDPRVQYFFLEHSGSPAIVRNFGLRQAKGDYLTFLDSDDEYLPEKLSLQIDRLRETSADVVAVGGQLVNNSGQVLKNIPAHLPADILPALLRRNFIFNPSMLTRAAYEKIGDFDEQAAFIEDWEYLIRAAEHLKITAVSAPLFKYRIHQTNFTTALNFAVKADAYTHILQRHQALYAFHPAVYASSLATLAGYCLLAGRPADARRHLKLARSLRPADPRLFARHLLTYGGTHLYRSARALLKRLRREYL